MKHTVTLANGITVPAIGLGTWYLGEGLNPHEQEVAALSAGLDAGMNFIDTAEMYGNGGSERLVGDVLAKRDRSKIYLVSKVLPGNANRRRMRAACEASLDRLGTDYLDLYLYHWRGSTPLRETVDCLEGLKRDGLIREWGVSNFDIDDMEELFDIPAGKNCLVNQVLYHAASRGIEFSLLPWMRRHNVALMSYCPLAQGGRLKSGLLRDSVLAEIAAAHNSTVTSVLLAWNIRDGHTIAIPRSASGAHAAENALADSIELTPEELEKIDASFPAPDRKVWLDMQ